jgi:hypothetical protein
MADTKTDTKTAKHVVTNITDGPKILNAIPVIMLQPGQATDGAVEMTEGEFASAKATDWFKFGAAAAKAADKD